MIHNMGGGGGPGATLNFRIVGGTTQPANAIQNTIWINTDTPITSWVFSAKQPSSPETGMVWIATSLSSTAEFNALKKNAVHVYPIAAYQYISGAWVDKTATTYVGDAWVSWRTYLYKNGNQFEHLTGGWVENGRYASGEVVFNETSFQVKTWNGAGRVYCSTNNLIDLTNINTLCVNVSERNGFSTRLDVLPENVDWYAGSTDIPPATASVDISKTGITELDVSALTGSYYIGIRAMSNGYDEPYSSDVTVTEVFMK